MKRIAIRERLRKAKSLAVRREIAHDWLANWLQHYDLTIRSLDNAVSRGEMQEAGRILGQLKALNDKRFGAMPNLIDKLCDEDVA
ncbi:hypothetical protein [Haematobacter sp. UBA3484]|uniref:hypothetical protein n=1 Tax=Haematobacter sp. UBA3484 TaxID=1946582 RepID=UPI0025C65B9A|nr:hypothetical protein [Haematobacter sp. UBA3484]